MKQKLKKCDGCGNDRPIWKNVVEDGERKRYCKYCWMSPAKSTERGSDDDKKVKPTTFNKKQKPIPRRSSKRIKQDALYKVLREQFLKDHPTCMIKIPGVCTGKSCEVHHSYSGKDREKYYLDTTTWFAVDRNCHNFVHEHPEESREMGYLK